MTKMKYSFLFLFVLLLNMNCSKKSDKVIDNPQLGHILIEADPSFKSVVSALQESYMNLNPKTTIDFVTKKEDLCFLDLLKNKARVVVMSRELSKEERAAYDSQVGLKWEPAKFAGDAVIFVVPKSSSRTSISYQEIQKELGSEDKNIVFDGTNSSNLNFVAQKFSKKPADLKFSIISGTTNLVHQLEKYPDKIGAISLNAISRPYGSDAEKLRALIKVLPVVKDGKSYNPSLNNIKDMEYPFTRILYFLTNEPYYGLGNGFIRFSCTQLGQLVVEKEGLQPYNTYKREVQMR